MLIIIMHELNFYINEVNLRERDSSFDFRSDNVLRDFKSGDGSKDFIVEGKNELL